MSQISCNKPVLMLLVLLTAASCCKKGKETIAEEKSVIVLGTPSVTDTKAAIDSLGDLKQSGLEIGVYGYKTQPINQTLNFFRLFNNTPVTYNAGNNIWSYNPTRYWDSNPVVTYQFFAYWPHMASSDAGDSSPWVDANDVNNLSSAEDMRVTLHNIPNWQDVANNNTADFLTSVKRGKYRTNVQEEEVPFYSGTVNFDFNHILSKLIIKGYYVGDQNNQVKVHNITISGNGILSANGTSTHESTIASESFTDVSKATAQQNVEQELYDNAQGCLIEQEAFRENDNDDQYIPTPICEWLLVPTDGWTGLTLSVTYAIGSAQPQTSEITNVNLGSGQDNRMASGNSYILNLKFNTEGGVELKTMYISRWVDVNVPRDIYNW